jgi:predicted dehydrogenase
MRLKLTRRDFSVMGGLSLAALQTHSFAQSGQAPQSAPAAQPSTGEPPVGFAAVGLGTISSIFMRACARSQKAKITALVTGHGDTKGKHFAAMYGVPESSIYSYEDYDRLRDNKAVDAVYIGLPNSMHREYTIRAAQAGKHVLCEKPMAISSAECREMIDACRKADRKLMIGYRVHYEPTHIEARRIVQSGQLGPVQAFEGGFGFNARPNEWRLTRQYAGGGSLMDVGIYPMNEIRWMLGEAPNRFTAVPSTIDHASGRFTQMEETLNWTMQFPSQVSASLACSYGASMPGFLRIHGTHATLEISPAYDYSGVHMQSVGGPQRVDMTSPGNQDSTHFLYEADHFADCIRNNTTPLTPGEEGLADLITIEAIYKAAGTPIA